MQIFTYRAVHKPQDSLRGRWGESQIIAESHKGGEGGKQSITEEEWGGHGFHFFIFLGGTQYLRSHCPSPPPPLKVSPPLLKKIPAVRTIHLEKFMFNCCVLIPPLSRKYKTILVNFKQPTRRLAVEVISQSETKSAQSRKSRKKERARE